MIKRRSKNISIDSPLDSGKICKTLAISLFKVWQKLRKSQIYLNTWLKFTLKEIFLKRIPSAVLECCVSILVWCVLQRD